MKILFLTQVVPYPPDAGPKVKTWHVLRYLINAGHQITLVSFVRKEEEPYLEDIRRAGIEVVAVPMRRSRINDLGYLALSILKNRSFLIERDNLPAMRQAVSRLMQEQAFDVIHADQFTMPQFVPVVEKGQCVRVFDAHNANWSVMERQQQDAPFFLKPLLAREQQKIKQYEGEMVRQFEYTLAVTEIDRRLLQEAVKTVNGTAGRIITIPIAVDTRAHQPSPCDPASVNIVTIGTLHYQPNADGIRWFLNEVFPLVRQEIPDITLTIIGKNPPPDFTRLAAQDERVKVTGYVPDLSTYLAQAALMVVPVRVGGGMRVRILEAFSRAMPVVTTTVGLEGIEAQPGKDVLVADKPDGFAREVIRVVKDPALRASLAANGRMLAEQKYDWLKVLNRLEEIYPCIK